MQAYDWNDLKYALSLHRAGSLAGAGRLIGVDETTVARRLKALERGLQTRLFVKGGSGRYVATGIGLAVIEKAESIERENAVIGETVGRFNNRLFGVVRITSVPMIVNRVLVPRLAAFRAANPDMTVELVPDSRNLSLTKREADLALRLGRPENGGLRTKARKIGTLAFAVYCSASEEVSADLEWIGYDDAHAYLPQARWLAAAGGGKSPGFACLRVSDAETAREAVAAGLGRTILPQIVADTDSRLRGEEFGSDLPVRDIWLLWHNDQEGKSAVSVAKDWLSAISWSDGG